MLAVIYVAHVWYNTPHLHGIIRACSPSKAASSENGHTHKCGGEGRQWRYSYAHLLCALAGIEVTGDSTLSPTLVVREARVLTLSALVLSAMFPNRTGCPETTILDERLRVITLEADTACTLTMCGVVDLVA